MPANSMHGYYHEDSSQPMILIVSTKERHKLGETRITGMMFFATKTDVSNHHEIEVETCDSGEPFFFDMLSDDGDWVSGGRFINRMPPVSKGDKILFCPGDLHLLSSGRKR
jgi:hypothetical protein